MPAERYAGLDSENFDRLLRDVIDEDNDVASGLLHIPGIYEVLREHYNNDVLQKWEEEQEQEEEDEE